MRYTTRAVLAAAYKGRKPTAGEKRTATLTHTHDAKLGGTLCLSVLNSSLADECATDPHAEPTCPSCRRKDPRGRSGGPFILASLLQL